MEEGMPDYLNAGTIPFEQLKFEEEIGSGSFGSVFRGSYLGTPVAIKKIAKVNEFQEELYIYVEREKAMTKYSHPHLVQFLGVAEEKNYVYLITEFVPGGDLRRYLKDKKQEVSWRLRAQVACDVAKAMAFLHSKGIMHRDLKGKNLLVDNGWKIKVCDFGFARTFEPKKRPYTICGTDGWMAPELIMGLEYSEKVDVFAYGIVLCEIIFRKKIPGADLQYGPEKCFCLDPDKFWAMVPKDCPDAFTALALSCLEYEAEKRPSFMDIIETLCQMVDELKAKGSSIRAPSGKVIQLPDNTPEPEIRKPVANRIAQTTAEKTKQALVGAKLKYSQILHQNNSLLHPSTTVDNNNHNNNNRSLALKSPLASPSERRNLVSTLHSVAKLSTLTFAEPEKFYSAIAERFNASSLEGWILIGYSKDKELVLQKSGTTVEELVDSLEDDQAQYALIRVSMQDPMTLVAKATTSRDVFIAWTGPRLSPVAKGKKKAHVGEVQHILSPFHAELTAVSKERFNRENVIRLSDAASGSHVID